MEGGATSDDSMSVYATKHIAVIFSANRRHLAPTRPPLSVREPVRCCRHQHERAAPTCIMHVIALYFITLNPLTLRIPAFSCTWVACSARKLASLLLHNFSALRSTNSTAVYVHPNWKLRIDSTMPGLRPDIACVCTPTKWKCGKQARNARGTNTHFSYEMHSLFTAS